MLMPEDITLEWALKVYKEAEMTPRSGIWGYRGGGGCILGAACVASGKTDLPLSRIIQFSTGLSAENMDHVMCGFDDGFEGNAHDVHHDRIQNDYYTNAYRVGKEMKKRVDE